MRELISHPDFARLHPTGSHPERTERLSVLQGTFPAFHEARPATREQIEACHDPNYVEHVRTTSASGHTRQLDPDTICTPSSYELALLGAGAAIEAVERCAFALGRPPGHHALSDRAMGFCLFNSIAIAARFAQRELGMTRIAILDWDVHHGNGTQELFWDDRSVLFASIHQWPFYPGTGGPGEGNETTVNVPLNAGSGDEQYVEVMERLIEPAIMAFQPELLLISCGYDAALGDPLGGMRVTQAGFRELAERASELAPRLAVLLEGGYNIDTLPALVGATLEGLAARDTGGGRDETP